MLDNNNNEILDGSETFIENRIKGYIQSGCKVTILQDKTVNENRKIVLIKVEEKQHNSTRNT